MPHLSCACVWLTTGEVAESRKKKKSVRLMMVMVLSGYGNSSHYHFKLKIKAANIKIYFNYFLKPQVTNKLNCARVCSGYICVVFCDKRCMMRCAQSECWCRTKSTEAFVNLNDYRLSCVRCEPLYGCLAAFNSKLKASTVGTHACTSIPVRLIRQRTPSHAAMCIPYRNRSLVCCFHHPLCSDEVRCENLRQARNSLFACC